MVEYGNCYKCGVSIEETHTTREYRVKGELIMVFEDVPTGICPECGEEFLTGEIAETMEAMALRKEGLDQVTFVPHVSLQPMAASK